jgi:hypothetical protein
MNDEATEFGCPICYENVRYEVIREDGPSKAALPPYPVYRCTGCDFHFIDPSAYPLRDSKRQRR